MKDYKRLTKRDWHNAKFEVEVNKEHRAVLHRLWDIENRIESGELISTVQSEQGEQEIAYFIKHNAAVRKQAVKEFSDKILSVSKITFRAFTDARIELSLAEYKQLIKEVCGE